MEREREEFSNTLKDLCDRIKSAETPNITDKKEAVASFETLYHDLSRLAFKCNSFYDSKLAGENCCPVARFAEKSAEAIENPMQAILLKLQIDNLESDCPYDSGSVDCKMASYVAQLLIANKKIDGSMIDTLKNKVIGLIASYSNVNKIIENESSKYMIFLRDVSGNISKTELNLKENLFTDPKSLSLADKNKIAKNDMNELAQGYQNCDVYLIDVFSKNIKHKDMIRPLAISLFKEQLEAQGKSPLEMLQELMGGKNLGSDEKKNLGDVMFG